MSFANIAKRSTIRTALACGRRVRTVPKDWFHKVARKFRASGELYHHLVGSIETPDQFEAERVRLATRVWRTMKATDSRECRNCHDYESMDYTLQESRASRRHQQGIEEGLTCIDCHKGIAHELPDMSGVPGWN